MSLRLTLEGDAKDAVTEMLARLEQENPEASVTSFEFGGLGAHLFFQKKF
jgi:hypothetical protein